MELYLIIIGFLSLCALYLFLQRAKGWLISKSSFARLQDQIVLVTGASSGLGEELARVFYERGCKLILAARRREELERVRQELIQIKTTAFTKQTHEPVVITLDLASEDVEEIQRVAEQIIQIHGRVDILVNNAGISSRATAIDTRPEVDRQMMLVNYLNQITLTKVILRSMLKMPKYSAPSMPPASPGHICVISSVQGRFAIPNRSSYSASKHAIQAFYDSLRAELSIRAEPDERPVHVTVVSPGYIRTNLSLNALTSDGSKYAKMDATTESGLEPAEVAKRVLGAVVNREPELILAPLIPRALIKVRAFSPQLYFYLMSKYAKKSH